jgi:hypothetical protein
LIHSERKEQPCQPYPTESKQINSQFYNLNQQNTPAEMIQQYAIVFDSIDKDLTHFIYKSMPSNLGHLQCRITRDKRGVEKGLYPMYYMHAERPSDGKKVRHDLE